MLLDGTGSLRSVIWLSFFVFVLTWCGDVCDSNSNYFDSIYVHSLD